MSTNFDYSKKRDSRVIIIIITIIMQAKRCGSPYDSYPAT
jgi:hypothetical protein